MKKYIPVFGPQELFDGAANCDEYLVAVQHSVGQKTKVSFYPSLAEAFNYVVDFPPRGVVFHRAAMRRIEEGPDSQLVTDGMPSFYVGSSGACTHKMAESDIPVWCNDVDDTCTAMGFINDCLRLTRKPKRWTVEDQKTGRLPPVGSVFTHRNETLTCLFIDADGEIWAHDINNRIVTPSLRNCYPLETPEEKERLARKEWCNRAMDYSTIQELYDAMLSGELSTPSKDGE